MDPAFEGDEEARLRLAAALNSISRNDIADGLKRLKSLEKKCKTDADRAAWLYFVGLAYEKAGHREEIIQ